MGELRIDRLPRFVECAVRLGIHGRDVDRLNNTGLIRPNGHGTLLGFVLEL